VSDSLSGTSEAEKLPQTELWRIRRASETHFVALRNRTKRAAMMRQDSKSFTVTPKQSANVPGDRGGPAARSRNAHDSWATIHEIPKAFGVVLLLFAAPPCVLAVGITLIPFVIVWVLSRAILARIVRPAAPSRI
jgi:hypothetical protein